MGEQKMENQSGYYPDPIVPVKDPSGTAPNTPKQITNSGSYTTKQIKDPLKKN